MFVTIVWKRRYSARQQVKVEQERQSAAERAVNHFTVYSSAILFSLFGHLANLDVCLRPGRSYHYFFCDAARLQNLGT